MSRPKSRGLEYLPLEVTILSDRKVLRLQRKCGPTAPLVYIALLCAIYKEGYYVAYDQDLILDLSEMLHMDERDVENAMQACLNTDLLDRGMYDEHGILTSRGIQRQYAKICRQSKRNVGINEYALIEVSFGKNPVSSEKTQVSSENLSELIGVNSEETPISSEETPIIPERMPQRKEKESKVDNPSLYSSPSGEDKKGWGEKERIVSFMTFSRNFQAPNAEYERLVAYHSGAAVRRKWADMTPGERFSAAVLWKQQPEQPPRYNARWLEAWKAVVGTVEDADVRRAMLSDKLAVANKAPMLQITCPAIVRQYIESHIDELRPMLLAYMNSVGCSELIYKD